MVQVPLILRGNIFGALFLSVDAQKGGMDPSSIIISEKTKLRGLWTSQGGRFFMNARVQRLQTHPVA